MTEVDVVRCNICDINLAAREVKDHAATTSHSSRKAKLEKELNAVRKEPYKNDTSVVVGWKKAA